MDESERERLASSRAETYAPRPTGGAVMAAGCGGGLVLGGAVIFAKFYGLELVDHVLATVVAMVVGALLGWTAYARLIRQNRRARDVERVQVNLEQDGD